MKFKRRPIVFEAVKWTGDNLNELLQTFPKLYYANRSNVLTILTFTGMMPVSIGQWVVRRGANGEFYLCAPDIFESTYEAVESISEQ